MAARTPGFTTRDSLVSGGIYAFIGVGGLGIFFIDGGGGRRFIRRLLPAGHLGLLSGLASLYLIPAVASYRRERGGRNAASQP